MQFYKTLFADFKIWNLCCENLYASSVINNTKLSSQRYSYLTLQGRDHATVNKPVISIVYIVAHTWPLCSAQILVDGVNPQ